MPFCLVLNDNNASSFVTYDTFHPVTPHSPHEPIFLISDSLEEGRDLNNLAYYFTTKKIKDEANPIYIPNHIYSYLNLLHTSSYGFSLEEKQLYEVQRATEKTCLNVMIDTPPEQRLRYQAERIAEDIVSKLSYFGNLMGKY